MASGAAARSVVSFSTAKARGSGQGGFEAYHDLYGPVADVVGLDARFEVSVEAQRLEDMILFDRRLRSVRHVRGARRVARNGFDHFTAQLALEGAFSVTVDEGDRVVKRGEMVMIDMTRPMATTATDARVLTLSTPRAIVERLSAGANDLHGAVVPESRAAMFGGLLASFLRFPNEQDPADRSRVAQVAIELLSLALSGRSEGEGANALSGSDLAAVSARGASSTPIQPQAPTTSRARSAIPAPRSTASSPGAAGSRATSACGGSRRCARCSGGRARLGGSARSPSRAASRATATHLARIAPPMA